MTTATKIKNESRGAMFSYFAIRYLSGIQGDLKEICRSEKFRSAVEKIDSKKIAGYQQPLFGYWRMVIMKFF